MTEPSTLIEAVLEDIAAEVTTPPSREIHELKARRQRSQRAKIASAVMMFSFASLALAFGLMSTDDSQTVATSDALSADETTDSVPSSLPSSTTTTLSDPGSSIGTVPTAPEDQPAVAPVDMSTGSTAAENAPDSVLYVQDGVNLVMTDGSTSRTVFRLEGDPSNYIESIAPGGSGSLLVGICCEPAAGRTLTVDIDTGDSNPLQLDGSYPNMGPDGDLVLTSDGYALRLADYSAVVEGEPYEATFLFENLQGEVPRSEWVGRSIVAMSAGDRLFLIGTDGSMVAAVDFSASQVVFDQYNDVLIAVENLPDGAIGTSLAILDKNNLELIQTITLEITVEHLDVADGWLLLNTPEGAVYTAPMSEPNEATRLVGRDASTSTWTVS